MGFWQRDQQPEYTLTALPTCPTNQDQLNEPDRQALRQHFENVIRSETQHAVVYGAGVPAGLLAFGLIMGWIVRGFRENHPR